MAIESRWFRVRRIGDGSIENPYRPEYSDRVEALSMFQLNDSPVMAMRAYAEPTVLDDIASEPRASEITTEEALNAFNGSEHPSIAEETATDGDDLNRHFRAEPGGNQI
jgi:hypothetical protein